ncbi:MrcB family domain-containing protein [Mycobacterium marinum]|uniref:MrcB family domain-containing protein n=1 Tax=Mycobacterium marinum TaxID=1781 RepID=UPI0023595D0F|nr:DUF3578 domain-containing protein [Mycobacterium marinum]MDC9014894.1 DUF3578 domain-containing protein [Mycobacterium marinum]
MALFDDIQTVLTAAAYYVREKSPEMDEREETLKSITATLQNWIPSEFAVRDEMTTLRAELGGRHGGVSPVPWVRVFSPDYSPRATEGFYLVYLFAGDGSRVYLSLNQGTSEWRSNAMRPINNEPLLLARASDARQLFEGWSPSLMERLATKIDLTVNELPVGAESKRRARNYELANVYALPYDRDTFISDGALLSDLTQMLPLLANVYAGSGGADHQAGGSALVSTPGKTGQTFVSDVRLRKALEDYSMAVVLWLYAETGEWDIEDVSKYRPYDVHLRPKSSGKLDVHVEVKGTTTAGETVFLTKDEVKDARANEHTVLAVVHSIEVSYQGDELICSGGKLNVTQPWTPADEDLTALKYKYRVPKSV